MRAIRLPRALLDAIEGHRARLDSRRSAFALRVTWSDAARDLMAKGLAAEAENTEARPARRRKK